MKKLTYLILIATLLSCTEALPWLDDRLEIPRKNDLALNLLDQTPITHRVKENTDNRPYFLFKGKYATVYGMFKMEIYYYPVYPKDMPEKAEIFIYSQTGDEITGKIYKETEQKAIEMVRNIVK